jgi:hypothetical protein
MRPRNDKIICLPLAARYRYEFLAEKWQWVLYGRHSTGYKGNIAILMADRTWSNLA